MTLISLRLFSRSAVTALACLITAACGSPLEREYSRLCEKAELKIVRKVARPESYFDATGNGCSDACLEDLQAGVVKFVEMRFELNHYNALTRGAPAYKRGEPLPPWSGLHAAFIPHTAECEPMFHPKHVWREGALPLRARCLQYREVAKLVSEYELQTTYVWGGGDGGFLTGGYTEIRRRATGEAIASGGAYLFEPTPLTSFEVRQRCGSGAPDFDMIIEK